jgi:Cysteine-rich secretory protein family
MTFHKFTKNRIFRLGLTNYFTRYNKISKILVLMGMLILFALPHLSGNLLAFAQELPATSIRPIQAVIRYRKSRPDRAENLPPSRRGYLKRGRGILTALQGNAYAKVELRQNRKILSPFINVGLDKQQTTDYYFPCPVLQRGTITVGWSLRKANSNKCARDINIAYIPKYSSNEGGYLHSAGAWQEMQEKSVDGKSEKLANGVRSMAKQIRIFPVQDVTLALVRNSPGKIEVDVLQGELEIDPEVESILKVESGNRYTYSYPEGGNITQSPSTVTDEPSVQKFLDPNDWSSEVQNILQDFRLSAEPQLSETAKEILLAHNQCRARVGVAPLQWSTQVATYAQDWADTLSKTGQFNHRVGGGSGFGENLAGGTGDMSPTDMVNMWCDEQSKYNPQTGSCRGSDPMSCYHFTQVVWSRTTELGCGLAPHPQWGKVLVCNYNPPGNYKGERPY